MTATTGPRSAVALLVVAAVIVIGHLVGGAAGGASLPDPGEAALRAAGRIETAERVERWSRRVRERPEVVAFRVALAEAQLALASETGDLELFERAADTARTALALDPEDEPASLALAQGLADQHDFTGALETAQAILGDQGTSVPALLVQGDALVELGRTTEAEASFRAAALELGGNPPALLSRFARLESVRGDTPAALALAERALIESGDLDLDRATAAFYWLQMATHEARLGDLESARRRLDAALRIDPENLGATELLAGVEARSGNDDDAIALYEDLIEQGPAADLYGELAKLYRRQGRHTESEEAIEAGLALARETAGRFPAERRHLISFLADHDPDLALSLAELDARTRGDVYSQAWLAWARLQTGDVAGAMSAIEPVVGAEVDDPWLLYQSGAILAAGGRAERAVELLDDALHIDPAFDIEHAQRANALLERHR